MTSDAKVGLLLGLVFIFIIAFVINGLPQFHKTEPGAGNLMTVVARGKQNLELGEYQKEQTRLFAPEKVSTPQQASANQTPATPEVKTPAEHATVETPQPTQVAENTDNTTRFQIALPNASSTKSVAVENQNPVKMSVSGDTAVSQDVLPQTNSNQASNNQQNSPKVEILHDPSSKTYTVKKGDSLSKISIKFYGSEEGVKNVNISRIREANSQIKSDQLKIGMELIIPSLPSTPQRDVPATTFEEVQSITPAVTNVEKTEVKSREITIKDRDSLWQIAAKNLGDGRRFTEIIKLNSDVLGGGNHLKVGMKLKLPEK